MKIKDSNQFGPYYWPQSGRPTQPYRIDPVSITIDPLDPWDQEIVDYATRPYIDGPIHTEVLKLGPKSGWRFASFAERYGLHEFRGWHAEITDVEWVSPGSLAEFGSVLDQYETGFRSFTSDDLASAWDSLPDDAILRYAGPLQRAFRYATKHAEDPVKAASKVLNDAWEFDALKIELDIDEDHSPPIIYERPQHIWSRGWFELIEGLREERLPKTCAHCGYHFVPRRSNKRFCGDQCGRRAYEKKRSKDPERRKAQAARYLKRKEAGQAGLSDGQPHGQSSPDRDDIGSNAEETGRQQIVDPAGTRRISSKET